VPDAAAVDNILSDILLEVSFQVSFKPLIVFINEANAVNPLATVVKLCPILYNSPLTCYKYSFKIAAEEDMLKKPVVTSLLAPWTLLKWSSKARIAPSTSVVKGLIMFLIVSKLVWISVFNSPLLPCILLKKASAA